MDAGRKEDATQISIATLAFTKSNVPSLYTTVLGLQVCFSPCSKSEPTSLDTMKGIIQCSLCVIGLFYFHNSYFDSDHVPMIFMRRHQQNVDWARLDQPLYSNDKRLRK